jgi:hypothetical protein
MCGTVPSRRKPWASVHKKCCGIGGERKYLVERRKGSKNISETYMAALRLELDQARMYSLCLPQKAAVDQIVRDGHLCVKL